MKGRGDGSTAMRRKKKAGPMRGPASDDAVEIDDDERRIVVEAPRAEQRREFRGRFTGGEALRDDLADAVALAGALRGVPHAVRGHDEPAVLVAPDVLVQFRFVQDVRVEFRVAEHARHLERRVADADASALRPFARRHAVARDPGVWMLDGRAGGVETCSLAAMDAVLVRDGERDEIAVRSDDAGLAVADPRGDELVG